MVYLNGCSATKGCCVMMVALLINLANGYPLKRFSIKSEEIATTTTTTTTVITPALVLPTPQPSLPFPYDFHAATSEQSLFPYDGRIVGGLATSIERHPYQVSLQHSNAHICGGSILQNNIILTAAHCIDQPWDVTAFTVRVGSSSHHSGGQLLKVRHIFKHHAYSTATLDYDVALIVLAENLTYSSSVQPIELAEANDALPLNGKLYATGWGLTAETNSVVAEVLNYVVVRLIKQQICTENYEFIATITSRMFCAGYPQGGMDSCQGDSGGPLVSYAADKETMSLQTATPPYPDAMQSPTAATSLKFKQYGIVSWGVGCAQAGYPGVYTNIPEMRSWIDARLNEVKYYV